MAKPSPWPIIHAERKALLADLEGLTDEQWATKSLCTDWTVLEVLGHMINSAKTSPAKFVLGLAGSGFRFHRWSAKRADEETAGTPADALARFREVLTATDHPPGPIDAMLGEVIVHPQDIRRPLGIPHQYPVEGSVRAVEFYLSSNLLIGGKRRGAGLTLRATDTDWSTGSGPEVAGPAASLALGLSGRPAALADLSGDGVGTLQGRM
jgi:uncharacterized protein (TIGR03083 family)